MNIKEFSYLLQNPAQLNKEQAKSLEKITRTFPYFQSARALALKSLKDQESFRYNQELKTTAAYTTDRSVLFDFITSDLFKESNITEEVKKKHKSDITVIDPEEIKMLPRIAMDDAVRMKMKEAENVLDPKLFSKRKENSTLKQIEIAKSATPDITEKDQTKNIQDKNKTPEETLQIDKPLDFNKKETHSFAEWLKLTSLHPIDRDSDQETKAPIPEIEEQKPVKSLDQKHKFDLIDEFIANNPKIQPAAKNTPARNLAKENLVPSDELMTETLARVYLVQKNYKKAIQAYNILILKNPEKSGFFADQIRAIKKLQENK
ncbi:DNA-directed RNA polymerase subunit H (RpoH/RPB5) [Aquimarina sp. EL_43]|uniref:hypothetical protein n=1 Tax=unclassified Aquimarina TaxID=2627091 RepID=UPI0018C8D8E1|nr:MULTISPECIES: hypothetical protein [unclassified Aquimarina]MBG6130398.1 DNA-directed RNA polymerase subunit H (RpoH/RPB5) [Aquimarina sp. EL_35]MBG6149178.1 DNA-directed RNA polymerase subunit H (RpoH/RPB5) [Aquimarina sp. EL_32]MBG6168448.1 DNA-directed RNA polymerase subunit H (RpoH/RPB5) [Aquimarina sp. EL_43]